MLVAAGGPTAATDWPEDGRSDVLGQSVCARAASFTSSSSPTLSPLWIGNIFIFEDNSKGGDMYLHNIC